MNSSTKGLSYIPNNVFFHAFNRQKYALDALVFFVLIKISKVSAQSHYILFRKQAIATKERNDLIDALTILWMTHYAGIRICTY